MQKEVAILKKLAAMVLTAFLLVALIPVPASAACSHVWKTYCDASHPHENYRMCTKCYTTQYLGTYRTKRHGSGASGSGTCPDCGSCSYSGRSCTSQGVCACGNTIAAYGHNYTGRTCTTVGTCSRCGNTIAALGHDWSSTTIYSEAAHPHEYFKYCARSGCYAKSYTGGNATKNHGDGSAGSGTCPSCGAHTYAPATCTKPQTCACGATFGEALGHNKTIHCDAVHTPGQGHRQFYSCSRCPLKEYTNDYVSKPHGTGAEGSGTCPSCGAHTYAPATCTKPQTCACGATYGEALGHNNTLYCDAVHTPEQGHRQFNLCSRCHLTEYTNDYVSKPHGTGADGSGTCKSCGTCAYVGQSCTAEGVCVCGETVDPLEHDYIGQTCITEGTCSRCGDIGPALGHNNTLYCDATHTVQGHRQFNYCSRCHLTEYTGNYVSKPHGTGADGSGTCPSCGTHTWILDYLESTHPHVRHEKCACNDTRTNGTGTLEGCSQCTVVPVTGIILSQYELAIDGNGTATLTASVVPSNATNQTLTWTSNQELIASVENGRVEGVNYGEAIITVSASNGVSASCNVKVYAYEATVNHYFDEGYRLFYSLSNTTASDDISSYRSAVNEEFWSELVLYINENQGPVKFSSTVIDDCKTRTPPAGDTTPYLDRNCQDIADTDLASEYDGYHPTLSGRYCTSRSGLVYDLYHNLLGDTSNGLTTNVIWSGHRIFSFAADDSLDWNRSASYPTSKVIAMIERSSTNRDRDSKGILFHELCHQFCSVRLDHYCELNSDNECVNAARCFTHAAQADKRPTTCIMCNSRRDITSADILCDACKADISAHLQDHH